MNLNQDTIDAYFSEHDNDSVECVVLNVSIRSSAHFYDECFDTFEYPFFEMSVLLNPTLMSSLSMKWFVM